MKYIVRYDGIIHLTSNLLPSIEDGRTIETERLTPELQLEFAKIHKVFDGFYDEYHQEITNFAKDVLKMLGYSKKVIDSVKVDRIEVRQTFLVGNRGA